MKIVKPGFVIEDDIDGEKILQKLEKAARTCYKSEDSITSQSSRKIIKKIIESHHESVLEHEKITARIICDRGISHELVRHRIASFSQESTRYCNYSKDKFGNEIAVIKPIFWSDSTDRDLEMALWYDAMKNSERYYFQLLSLGATPQEARSVLPNSLKTEIVITANLREWRTILRQRTAKAAHPQMRQIMIPLLKEFKRLIPIVFDDILEEN